MHHFTLVTLYCLLTSVSCDVPSDNDSVARAVESSLDLINETGNDVRSRFNPPPGFKRSKLDSNSFAFYLSHLPLKPAKAKVTFYNGDTKSKQVHEAVVDMRLGNKNLQQCADAVIRLRAEYFFARKEYHKISFALTNGFDVDYLKWMQGYRVVVKDDKTSWKKMVYPSNSYKDFEKYLELLFTYAGTLSLAKSLKPKNLKDISIGDVFIVGGSPGHAVIVVDVAENEKEEKVFMLAQSYMPAQETHILKNLNDKSSSPWYRNHFSQKLYTPEWTFSAAQLKTW